MSAERAACHWADFFGVARGAIEDAGTRFVPHAGLGDWNGLWVFRRGDATLVSAPRPRVAGVRAALDDLGSDALCDAGLLRDRLGRPAAAVIGPSWWGRLDAGTHRPARDARVRTLGAGDAAALTALRGACGADWEVAGLSVDPGHMPMWGAFEGERLVAVAGWRARGPGVGDPCLLTAPDRRGAGLATAVASAACASALARGDLALYQTLRANAPAVAVARRLGFVPDASHLAVRLGEPA